MTTTLINSIQILLKAGLGKKSKATLTMIPLLKATTTMEYRWQSIHEERFLMVVSSIHWKGWLVGREVMGWWFWAVVRGRRRKFDLQIEPEDWLFSTVSLTMPTDPVPQRGKLTLCVFPVKIHIHMGLDLLKIWDQYYLYLITQKVTLLTRVVPSAKGTLGILTLSFTPFGRSSRATHVKSFE